MCIATCHCERSAAIRFRVCVATAVFLLAIVSTATAKYSGGSGTAHDQYQIATASDLIALGETPADYGKHFILTADIDLDPKLPGRKVFDKAVIALGTMSASWAFQGTPFTGVFDGNGHTISHLTVTAKDYLGLFGQLAGEVKNLGVVDVSITASGNYIGGLVGGNSGTVTQCYSTGAVSGNVSVGGLVGYNEGSVTGSHSTGTVDGNYSVGGLVGCSEYGTVTQCSSSGAVAGEGDVGGLVGYNSGTVAQSYSAGAVAGEDDVGGLVGQSGDPDTYEGAIIDSYSTGAVSGTRWNVGGLVGWNIGGVTQCYSTGAVSGQPSVGGLVGEKTNPWGWGGQAVVTTCFWDTQTSGQATSAVGTGKTTAQMQDPNTFMVVGWDFVGQADGPHDIWAEPEGGGYPILSWQLPPLQGLPRFSGGTGEPNDPYMISRPEELNSIGHNPRLMKCHFKLVSDLDLTGIRFYPIGGADYPYGGVFDGNGHTISDLTINGGSHVGLFGQLASGAEVRDLGVVDVNITGAGDYVGGLVGSNGSWNSPGGRVTRCYSSGEVSSSGVNRPVGGLVGWNSGTVTQCYSTGAVSGTGQYASVGGLVGYNLGTVAQCYSTGVVTGTGQYGCVGGLVGGNSGTVTQCYSTGAVSGTGDAGGLVGVNSYQGRATDCYSTGAVKGDGRVGGLVGFNVGTVTQCYSTGTVSGTQSVGGLIWSNYGAVTACFWDTQTSGRATSDGGTGKTTAQMQTAATFLAAGWDFVGETANGTEDIWKIAEGLGYPRLAWEKYSGGTGEPNDPYQIATAADLIALGEMPEDYDKHFVLTADIDLDPKLAGGRVFDRAVIAPDTDPAKYEFQGTPFAGIFDGNGHTISHLTIMGASHLGLFGYLGSWDALCGVKDLGLVDLNITGSGSCIGGLVGTNGRWNNAGGGTVTRCYSTGTVSGGGSCIGGLVGNSWSGSVTTSHSTAAVSGGDSVGGLMGRNHGMVVQSYSIGAINGSSEVGGLVGCNPGTVNDCYSTGTVSGGDSVGGLVGHNWGDFVGDVTHCYSTGAVSGGEHIGGLVGLTDGYEIDCFWDIQTSGQTISAGGTGKTTVEMQTAKTFLDAGWDFVGETKNGTKDIWWILEGKDYPRLWWEARN